MKRYGRSGWYGERHRHYLAAKGIKTKRYLVDKDRAEYGGQKKNTERMEEYTKDIKNTLKLKEMNPREQNEIRDSLAHDMWVQENVNEKYRKGLNLKFVENEQINQAEKEKDILDELKNKKEKEERLNNFVETVDIKEVADKIEGMNSYGLHREIDYDNDSVKLSWSNGSAKWGVYWRVIPKGKVVELDANETLFPLPGLMHKNNELSDEEHEAVRVLASMLPALPLYKYSTEAKEDMSPRTRKEATDEWMRLQSERMKREEEERRKDEEEKRW